MLQNLTIEIERLLVDNGEFLRQYYEEAKLKKHMENLYFDRKEKIIRFYNSFSQNEKEYKRCFILKAFDFSYREFEEIENYPHFLDKVFYKVASSLRDREREDKREICDMFQDSYNEFNCDC